MKEAVIFAVTGGRDYCNKETVFRKLDKFHRKYRFTHLLSGGASGVDSMADLWCDTTKGVQSVICRAHWTRDGKPAGPIRNTAMSLLRPTRLVAFPGGSGTEHMKSVARKLGIKIITVSE